MEELLRLYEDWRGCAPQSVEQLPGAGSNRTYYRFWDAEGDSLIGVVGTSREENEAFIYLAGHFGQKRLPMPRVVADEPFVLFANRFGASQPVRRAVGRPRKRRTLRS